MIRYICKLFNSQIISSQRTIDVYNILQQNKKGLSPTQVARKLNLPNSSYVAYSLKELRDLGFVDRVEE